jgi:hypothetical protein
MSGYVHYLLQQTNTKEILILVKDNYSKHTVQDLYSDYPEISLYYFNDDTDMLFCAVNRQPKDSTISYNNTEYIIKNFGCHSQSGKIYMPQLSWADSFYLSDNISPLIRYNYFRLPTDMDCSKNMHSRLIEILKTDKYILLHDDPSRGRPLNYDYVNQIIYKNGNTNLPIIYLGLNRYNFSLISPPDYSIQEVQACLNCKSILDLYDTIANATECHFMDSSIACLTDQIKDSKSLLYNHSYASHAHITLDNITLVNRKWVSL